MTAKSILTAAFLIAATALPAADLVEPDARVRLESGREFRGTIDADSDSYFLVLTSGTDGITLKRSIRWERLVEVAVAGVSQDVVALRSRYGTETKDLNVPSGTRQLVLRAWPAENSQPVTPVELNESPRVAVVAFDPQIANWDADIETDGVLIDVAPVDAAGNLLAVAGTLEVELFVPERRVFDQAPQSGGDTLELVERWTRAIHPEDYGPRGARLRLPFGAITPELQPDRIAWHYGLVHARLSIPGSGVFEYSRDGIRIRPWAPNRDRLEMKTGQRFLPTEKLGRRD